VSVSSVGGAGGWFSYATAGVRATAASPGTSVAAQTSRPDDPLNQGLTVADRSAIKSSTGVDVRADGGILSPMSMSASDYGAVMSVVGQLAADRANGSSLPLTSSSISALLGKFGFRGTEVTSDGASAQLRVDFLA
jgi:hypothetical protein